MKTFKTQLPKFPKSGRLSGWAMADSVYPGEVARSVLGDDLDGNLLNSYLFRRFGFPNSGWDGYKDLSAYLLTTPMKGLYLGIHPVPYKMTGLLSQVSAFYVRMTDRVRSDYEKTQCEYSRPSYEFIRDWAKDRFFAFVDDNRHLQVRPLEEGEEPVNLPPWGECDEHWVFCLRFELVAIFRKERPDFDWSTLGTPRKCGPQLDEWRDNPRDFIWDMNAAIEAAVRDLLRPTYVHDYNFNALGELTGKYPEERRKPEVFKDAGCTAEYLYVHRPKEQAKDK